MTRTLTVLALLVCAACYKKDPELGTCTSNDQCKNGATCSANGVCEYACPTLCGAAEQCIDAQCIAIGPAITNVSAPTTWSSRAQTITVTATVDGTKTSGVKSAALRISGKPDLAGTPSDTGVSRTYSFSVIAGDVQPQGSEAPIAFTIVGVGGNDKTTPPAGAGVGQLLIDALGPSVLAGGITLSGGVGVGAVQWFKSSSTPTIDVTVKLTDGGSGVNASTVKLNWSGGRLDNSAPTCSPVTGTKELDCVLHVPTAPFAGTQQVVDFTVAAQDILGNVISGTPAGKLGIDDVAPTVTFAPTYPTAFSGCNGNTDPGATMPMFCGHDAAGHYWRKGEPAATRLTFTVDDAGGSGTGTAGAKYWFPSATTGCSPTAKCDATFVSSTTFSVPADFSTAPFTSGDDGTGTVDVTVVGQDAVGNPGTEKTASIKVTRVKWVRQVSPVTALVGAPALSNQLKQVIVGGTSTTADPIVALKSDDGSVAWSFGLGKFTAITTNMALDTTTSADPNRPSPVLYLNAGSDMYAVHITALPIAEYCAANISATDTTAGAPVVFGGGPTGAAVAVAGNTIRSVVPLFRSSHTCSIGGSFSFTNTPLPPPGTPTPQPVLGPPSAAGNTIFFGYDNSAYSAAISSPTNDMGLKSIQFDGANFATPSGIDLHKSPTAGTSAAAISPAGDLYFGIDVDRALYRYTTGFANVWGSPSTPALTAPIFSQPLVVGSVALASSNALVGYGIADGKRAWTALAATNQVSPPTMSNGSVFVSDSKTPEMVALDPGTRAQQWRYLGDSASTPLATKLSSVATEATLGADGTLYFGDSNGHVYAIITEATPTATQPGEWPRTGYDNCNSNHAGNIGFTCQ